MSTNRFVGDSIDARNKAKVNAGRESSQAHSSDQDECFQLRSIAAQLRQEHDAMQAQLKKLKKTYDATANELHQSELGRKATEEYARKLESKLERSGKGVALMKAVRLQSDVEFLERQSNHLYEEMKGKDARIDELTSEISRQKTILDEAAKEAGLPGWHSLEELSELRLRVQSLADSLSERDDKIKRQQADLDDFRVYRSERATIQARCDEMEALLQQSDDDKSLLLEAFDDQKHQLERNKSLIMELTASRDEFAQKNHDLEMKRVDLERLLREQMVILSATKQHSERLEASLHAQKKSTSNAERERDELQHRLMSAEKQRSAMRIELTSMSDQMQGVLDLEHLQQAELHTRVTDLTHRITSTLQGQASPASLTVKHDDSAEGVLMSLTRCSRQQEALVGHLLTLKEEVRRLYESQGQNSKQRDLLERQQSEYQQLVLSSREMERQMREQSAAWAHLAVSTSGSLTYAVGKEMEVAREVLKSLSQLRSSQDSLTFKLEEMTRERDRLRRNNEGLNEGMRSRQEAMSSLAPMRDFNAALSRIQQLEELIENLRMELQKAHENHMVDLSELSRCKERLDQERHRSTLTREEEQREKDKMNLAVDEARQGAQAAMRLVQQLQETIQEKEGEILRLKAKQALLGVGGRESMPSSPFSASPSYHACTNPARMSPRSLSSREYDTSFTFQQPLSPRPSPSRHQSPFLLRADLPSQPAPHRPRPRPKTPVSSSDDDSETGKAEEDKPRSPAPRTSKPKTGNSSVKFNPLPQAQDLDVNRRKDNQRSQIATLAETYRRLQGPRR